VVYDNFQVLDAIKGGSVVLSHPLKARLLDPSLPIVAFLIEEAGHGTHPFDEECLTCSLHFLAFLRGFALLVVEIVLLKAIHHRICNICTELVFVCDKLGHTELRLDLFFDKVVNSKAPLALGFFVTSEFLARAVI
jgi:hypothetical protein